MILLGSLRRLKHVRIARGDLRRIRKMWRAIRQVIEQRKSLWSTDQLRRRGQVAQAIEVLERHVRSMEHQPEADEPWQMSGRAVSLGRLGSTTPAGLRRS
jgi:hypothetical protein